MLPHSPCRCKEISAFKYDAAINYADDSHISIGNMSTHCQAKKWPLEAPGLCCAGEKVQLNEIVDPPEPLKSLISGTRNHSKVFFDNIPKYNSAFQMTSFGGKEMRHGHFKNYIQNSSTAILKYSSWFTVTKHS